MKWLSESIAAAMFDCSRCRFLTLIKFYDGDGVRDTIRCQYKCYGCKDMVHAKDVYILPAFSEEAEAYFEGEGSI